MKTNWNFQRGGGVQTKKTFCGRGMGISFIRLGFCIIARIIATEAFKALICHFRLNYVAFFRFSLCRL